MFDSPLRYPGGKGRLSRFVIDLIEVNELVGGHYVEAYAGGAGIAVTLLYLEYVSHVHLNDLDPAVYSFWRSILDEPDSFLELLHNVPITLEERTRQKAIFRDSDSSVLERGFATFFLNRVNRSGILLGGVIGGTKQEGTYKIDARFNRSELARRIAKVASFAPRITVYNKDASDFLVQDVANFRGKVLVYLDPPYYANGSRLYRNTYKHPDHAKIAKLASEIVHPWIVSYDNAPEVRELYGQHRQTVFGLGYSANKKYEGKEVMVFGSQLKVPSDVAPWRGFATQALAPAN